MLLTPGQLELAPLFLQLVLPYINAKRTVCCFKVSATDLESHKKVAKCQACILFYVRYLNCTDTVSLN